MWMQRWTLPRPPETPPRGSTRFGSSISFFGQPRPAAAPVIIHEKSFPYRVSACPFIAGRLAPDAIFGSELISQQPPTTGASTTESRNRFHILSSPRSCNCIGRLSVTTNARVKRIKGCIYGPFKCNVTHLGGRGL